MRRILFFIASSFLGFSLFLVISQYHSARLRSLFFPDRPKQIQSKQPLLYGVNIDISQILPTSEHYVVDAEGNDLIDRAAAFGIRIVRITNNTKSFDNRAYGVYTQNEWYTILNKMEKKNMKALIVIEAASDNPNLYKKTIHDDYLSLVGDYIIDSGVLTHPALYGIDLKNEPILNDHNISMIRQAASMIRKEHPDTSLTVGAWAIDTGRDDEKGEPILYWEDFAAGRMLADSVDFYSLHIYGFDTTTFGLHVDPYTYTKQYIANALRGLQTDKPLLVEEFGTPNGQAVSDQETIGSPQLQANAYAGVYKALVDIDDPQIVGAVSYQFHSQSDDPDAWAILRNNGNSLLPAAYVLQKFATGDSDISLTIPMNPVPKDYLFDADDDDKTITLRKNDIVGFSLSLDPSYQYSAVSSDTSILIPSQQLTYNEKFRRYHAVFHTKSPGKAGVIVQRSTKCPDSSLCNDREKTVFSMRFSVER